jgi:hypothetical protein
MQPTSYELFVWAAENFYTLCTVRDLSELPAEQKRMDEAWEKYQAEQKEG